MEQIVFAAAGCGGLLYGAARLIYVFRFRAVPATCVQVQKRQFHSLGLPGTSSKITYRYVVDGKAYTYTESGFPSGAKWQVGDSCVVRVNRKNPSRCYPQSFLKTSGWYLLLGAACLLAAWCF